MSTANEFGERRPTATLIGEAGKETAERLTLLALGHISLEEAGPAFEYVPGGIALTVDEETWKAFGFRTEGANGEL